VARGSTYTGTGGAATDSITLSTANMPAHTHTVQTYIGSSGTTNRAADTNLTTLSSGNTWETNSAGSGSSFSVDTLPPYQAVYTWERTA
jgi:microcystin-dependent protein